MGISNFTLNRIIDSIKDELINAKIERIINISDNDYILSIFKEGKCQNLMLSLDASLPLILLAKAEKVDAVNVASFQCNMLRKYLDHGTIQSFKKIKDDRIVVFEVKKWTQTYQLITSKIIFELFPLSPNIIITDENYVILDAFKKSESLDSKHPIYKGLRYQFPQALDKYFDINSSLEDLKGKISKTEYRYLEKLDEEEFKINLQNLLNEKDYYLYKNEVSSLNIHPEARLVKLENLYEEILNRKTYENKVDKYEHVFKLVESKIKSIKKRIINIEKDKEKFLQCDVYQEKGNMLYLAFDQYVKGSKKIDIDGYVVELDPKLDLKENAQRYFKLYKKAKSGLIQVEIQKENALKELTYFEAIQSQIRFATNQDMMDILLDLESNHYLKTKYATKKEKNKPGNKKFKPHIFTLKTGTKIGFGLSSYQNEELTFSLAKKSDMYLHIKDFHGPHVVIFSPSPTEKELRLAGELALYFASQTAGEVYYTPVKYVKKVPSIRGLVTMQTMKTMVINNIQDENLKLFKSLH